MRVAIMFSGQGAQHADMLPWLHDSAALRQTAMALAQSDWRAPLRDPAWAQTNLHAQVLLTGTSIAAWQQLRDALPPPVAVAGYSVGELAAFCAAGVLSAHDAITLAASRARAMDSCAAGEPGSLMGVTGLSFERLAEMCHLHHLDIAIHIGPHSAVVAGPTVALDRSESAFTQLGARCTRLRVGVRSHTPVMSPASESLLGTLREVPFASPATALICNATGEQLWDAESCRHMLAAQISTTMRWARCLEALRARQPDCVLEIGPGQALARMWNERYGEIEARACDDFRSAEAVVRWVAGHGASRRRSIR